MDKKTLSLLIIIFSISLTSAAYGIGNPQMSGGFGIGNIPNFVGGNITNFNTNNYYNVTQINNITNNITYYAGTIINNITNNITYLLNDTFNATYDKWAYNQTYTGGTYNVSYHAGLNWFYNMSTPFYTWVTGFVYNYNQTYTGGTYNVTYNTWAYNQSDGSYNLTYSQWAYNQTTASNTSLINAYGKWFYNMSSPFYTWVTGFNFNYNQSTAYNYYNQTTASNTSLINAYGKWFYNMSDGSYNSTYAAYAYNQTQNLSAYWNKSENINMSRGYNISVNDGSYLMGQPLLGMLGSGLIRTNGSAGSYVSSVNVTCTGLSCTYPYMEFRIMQGNAAQFATYCNIPSGTLTVPDNQNNMYYVNTTCGIQVTTYDNWFQSRLNQGGAWDFANIVTHGGSAEVVDTISLEQRRLMKARILNYYEWQAKIVSGMNIQYNNWNYFNITNGSYVYGMDVVSTNAHNLNATNLIEAVGHNSSTTWQYDDVSGLNVTSCDTGTSVTTCTGANYRRHFIFIVGYNEGTQISEVHQLYPLQSVSYSTLAQCLDTTSNPLTYTLPNEYLSAAVMMYAYCARRTDIAWSSANLIDLRTIKSGISSGGGDTSTLVPYTGASTNVDVGVNNITANWFFGKVNISNIQNFNYNYNQTDVYWNHTAGDVLSISHPLEKICIGSGCIVNPFYKFTIEGGLNVTGIIDNDGVFISNALTKNLQVYQNLSAQNLFANNICYSNGTNAYTYNSTYDTWAYNMSDGSYNSSYVQFQGNNAPVNFSGHNITGVRSILFANATSNDTGQWLTLIPSASSRLYLSTNFNVLGTLFSDSDIYTTGTGDDLWLGTGTQASAFFRAYADGTLYTRNVTVNGTLVVNNTAQFNRNINMTYQNITDVATVTFKKISGSCDLTLNGSLCSNSTGTYIIG